MKKVYVIQYQFKNDEKIYNGSFVYTNKEVAKNDLMNTLANDEIEDAWLETKVLWELPF